MNKNKFLNLIILSLFAFLLSFLLARASTDSLLPDNVKVISNKDGSSTTIIINSKPGFSTNVVTNCTNSKCTSTAISNQITEKDLTSIKDNIKKTTRIFPKILANAR